MTGTVSHGQILLSVPFRLPSRRSLMLEFVVDTGFTDFLTLPPTAVAAMALPFVRRESAALADGSHVEFDLFSATIVWDGAERDVPVLSLGDRPLLGTALLDGHELVAQFTDGGLVTVDSL